MSREFDLLVEGAAVVTVDSGYRVFDPGYLGIKDGRIVAIGPMEELPARGGARVPGGPRNSQDLRAAASRVIDGRGKFVMPGFVNTHTHIPMAAFRGACEDVPDRLTRFIFPMENSLVTPDQVYWSSLHCLVEMARSGTTTFADMYYFEDEVARATDKSGLRALLGETILGQKAPDAADAAEGMAYTARFIDAWKGHPRIKPCYAPHAPYTVDADTLAWILREAERRDVDIMMHVAEMDFEHARFSAAHGSVLRYLDTIGGLLSPRLLAVHMLYLDEADLQLVVDRKLRVAHCPASNAKSGRKICPAWRLSQGGVPLGLGTDGPLSGNGMDMQGVLNLFPKLQKVREGRRDILTAKEALRAATLGGAEVLGMDTEIGSLETGKRADFVIADARDFNIQPVYDWHATIVYAMRPHNVESVYVEGSAVVENRRMTGFDEDEVMKHTMGLRASCAGFIAEIERRVAR